MDLIEFNINHVQSIQSVTEFGWAKTMKLTEFSSLILTIFSQF